MAETSKNNIYYNDNEDSIADVLEDMKKLAESTDNAIEKAKYNDTELKNKNKAQDEEIAEIKEKDTTQDSLIEKLQTKVVNLEAENTSLKNQIPSGEATGNPIHLTDSSNLPCEIALLGNSEQETRSGKNKIKLTQTSQTKNGLTIVVDKGKMIINGTATANTEILIYSNSDGLSVNGDYYFSTNVQNALTDTSKYGWINMYNGSTQLGYLDTMSNGKQFSFENQTITKINFDIKSGAVCNDLTFEFQLEPGTTKTDFEQYGESPSPDYPSPVETVGQNVNIYDENGEKTDIFINASGSEQIGSNGDSFTKQTITNNIAKQYVMSFENNYSAYVRISYYNNGTFISRELSNANNYIFTVPDGCTKIDIRVDEKTVSSKYFQKLKIEPGAKATSYSPYGHGSVEISVDNGLETTDTNYQSYTKVLPIQEEMLDEDYISDKEYHNWEKIDSYNGEEITTDFKSTTGELTTGATVYYKLATPKELELTAEQSEILNSFYTYKGITNISVDGIGTLKVNYKKDLETIINNLSATSVAE